MRKKDEVVKELDLGRIEERKEKKKKKRWSSRRTWLEKNRTT